MNHFICSFVYQYNMFLCFYICFFYILPNTRRTIIALLAIKSFLLLMYWNNMLLEMTILWIRIIVFIKMILPTSEEKLKTLKFFRSKAIKLEEIYNYPSGILEALPMWKETCYKIKCFWHLQLQKLQKIMRQQWLEKIPSRYKN